VTSAWKGDLVRAGAATSGWRQLPARPARPGSLTAVRLTEFWQRMDEQFGSAYAQSVAKDFVVAGLDGRTVAQALADGDDVKTIWRAVCGAFNVPDRLR
jgi:hypothetical protein